VQTSVVTALFLDKKLAMECLSAKNRVQCDKRWIEETKKVLAAIGEEHPYFSISHSTGLKLIE
jgi:hypothetical protein